MGGWIAFGSSGPAWELVRAGVWLAVNSKTATRMLQMMGRVLDTVSPPYEGTCLRSNG